MGCAKEYSDLLQMMLNGLALPENPESLIMPGYAQSGAENQAEVVLTLLPDSATICSCNNVSKAGYLFSNCRAVRHHSVH